MDTTKDNTLIMVLICSAVVLLVVLCLVTLNSGPQIAVAGSMQDRGGDYSITVARLSQGQETVWVLDCRNETVGVYLYDNGSRRLELQRRFPLSTVQTATR